MLTPNEILFLLLMAFVAFAAVFVGFTVLIFWYATRKARARKAVTDALAEQFAAGGEAHPVRYSGEQRFRKVCKIFPWEGVGVLVKTSDGIVFHGRSLLDSSTWRIEFGDVENFRLLGMDFWLNGVLSWIMAKDRDGSIHNFSSETGVTVFGSTAGAAKLMLQIK